MTTEHDTIEKVVACIRTWHGAFSDDICNRLERIDAEMRDDNTTSWRDRYKVSETACSALTEKVALLHSDNDKLRERLAAAEKLRDRLGECLLTYRREYGWTEEDESALQEYLAITDGRERRKGSERLQTIFSS